MDRIINPCSRELFDIAVILNGLRTWVRVQADSVEQAKIMAQKDGFTLAQVAA